RAPGSIEGPRRDVKPCLRARAASEHRKRGQSVWFPDDRASDVSGLHELVNGRVGPRITGAGDHQRSTRKISHLRGVKRRRLYGPCLQVLAMALQQVEIPVRLARASETGEVNRR